MFKNLFKRKHTKKIPRGTDVILTVSGQLSRMIPAVNRPGCILEMTDGRSKGRYYVPLQPHDCRLEFPENTHVAFRIYAGAKPDKNGIINTAGTVSRLWRMPAV